MTFPAVTNLCLQLLEIELYYFVLVPLEVLFHHFWGLQNSKFLMHVAMPPLASSSYRLEPPPNVSWRPSRSEATIRTNRGKEEVWWGWHKCTTFHLDLGARTPLLFQTSLTLPIAQSIQIGFRCFLLTSIDKTRSGNRLLDRKRHRSHTQACCSLAEKWIL